MLIKRFLGSIGISVAIAVAVLFIFQAVSVDAVDDYLAAGIDDQLVPPAAGIWYIAFLYAGLIVGAFAIGNMITSRTVVEPKRVLASNTIGSGLALLLLWAFSCVAVFALNPNLSAEFILVANTLLLIAMRDPNLYFMLLFAFVAAFNTMTNILTGVY